MLLAMSDRQDTELAMASRQPVSDEAACWGHTWHAPNCGSPHSFSLMLFCYGLALHLQSLGRGVFLLQTLLGAVELPGQATTTSLLRCLGHCMTLVDS